MYAGSAIVSAGVAVTAAIPIFREWARLAVGPYAVGAVAVLLVTRMRDKLRARIVVAGLILAGVVLAPLALETAWRARTEPGLHAQSEVIITEEAAVALVQGRNPYRTDYLEGPLAARPVATKSHFPYPPGMLLFGLPRAAFGHHAWTDARVWFLAATVAIAGVALATWRSSSGDTRLRVVQWLLLVPSGALLAATEGHDLPAVALLLLATTLVREGRPVAAGFVAGTAVALKQTALVVVPFLFAAAAAAQEERQSRHGTVRMLVPAVAVAGAIVAPFVAWDPDALWEDVIRFPLGFGSQENPNTSPSIGRALVAVFPSAEGLITGAMVVVALAVWAWLVLKRPAPDAAGAARRAGMAFLAILALLPATRIGYLVYPVNLLAWGYLLERDPPLRTAGSRCTRRRRPEGR
jgi:hypothetical protein